MKKLLTCMLALTLLVALALPARADVIWEPYEDKFYEDNQDQFTYAGNAAYANSPTGSLELCDKPNGKVIGTIPNGETIHILKLILQRMTEDCKIFCHFFDKIYEKMLT